MTLDTDTMIDSLVDGAKPSQPFALFALAADDERSELARRVEAAPRPARELADPDVFVLGFWYQAAIAVFFADTYPVDFVRHRCRLVARELVELLPDLDPEPDRPAATAPRP